MTHEREIDAKFMRLAIEEGRKCISVQSAFNVGAILVHDQKIISTGYSREIPGNTHAEQCCLLKAREMGISTSGCTIYSTMEPCGERLSGNICCALLIIDAGIKRVVQAVKEPSTFIGAAVGTRMLQDKGIAVDYLQEFEKDSLDLNTHLQK